MKTKSILKQQSYIVKSDLDKLEEIDLFPLKTAAAKAILAKSELPQRRSVRA